MNPLFRVSVCMTLFCGACSTASQPNPSEPQILLDEVQAQGHDQASSSVEVADTLIYNAQVYSLAWPDPDGRGVPHATAPEQGGVWRPDADSIALAAGKVVAVGSAAQTQLYVGPETTKIDLQGATVLPGLIDSHTHIIEMGRAMGRPDLRDLSDIPTMLDRMAIHAESLAPGAWLHASGFDEGAFADHYPDRRMLDERFPERPVYVRGLHGFAAWLNSAALKALAIDLHTPEPSGGQILRSQGRLTGIVLNNAVDMVDAALPEPSIESLEAAIVRALKAMATAGYVAVHEAGVPARALTALQNLAKRGELPIRVYAMLDGTDPELLAAWRSRGPLQQPDSALVVRSVKAYYDGSLGARGAALLADYADHPGHRGVAGKEYQFDREGVAAMAAAGFQLAVHAIGDAGNRQVLDFLAALPPRADARHRIEHAQVLAPTDLPRLAKLGVVASMQAVHCVEDMPWVHSRIGETRARGAYAWRSLRLEGTGLVFNSDLPGSSHDVFYGLHSAVTRQNPQGQPTGGFHPEERLTVEEALRAYTVWAAYAGFAESSLGSIMPGKSADLTVVDLDPFAIAPGAERALLEGKILRTMVAGRWVYQRASKAGPVARAGL